MSIIHCASVERAKLFESDNFYVFVEHNQY